MEKMNDEQLKRQMPFDLYGRYAIIREIIDTNRENGEKFKVLDVGGRGNMMKKFLPEDDVFYLDPLVDTQDENYIEGDGCAMPLADGSFDWVVSGDVFEHIPNEKKEDFLKENIRVAKLGVVLVAPFDSTEVRQAEINANENYKILSGGEDHIWLKEHIANGLPKEEEIEKFLETRGFEFQKMHNNGLFIWENLQGVSFLAQHNLNEKIKKELEEFNGFYNSEAFPFDSAEPSYRKIYFIKKDAKLKNIETKSKPIDDLLFLNIAKKAMDLIGKVDVENKKLLRQKNATIRKATMELGSVYASREWQAVLALRKIVKIFVPKDSARRKIAVGIWRMIKKPLKLARKSVKKSRVLADSMYYRLKPKKPRKINLESKKIVFVGHSYHKKTRSADFLTNFLKQFYDVEWISDESWLGKPFPDVSFINDSYLAVILWQSLPSRKILNKIKNENVILFPMYGSIPIEQQSLETYRSLKIVNFSRTLHAKLKQRGFDSMYIQYFTDFQKFIPGSKNEVFFWQRITKININILTKLFEAEKLKIHIHKGIDPYEKFVQPSQEIEKKFQITYTNWFESRDEMLEKIGGLIRQKGIYVAPRALEGIGMSFLEAMAMGKAVIAVDNPTMNEYIEHGKTGYLFDLSNPKKIDLSNLEQVQKNAYEFARNGREKWEKEKHKIIDFIKKR